MVSPDAFAGALMRASARQSLPAAADDLARRGVPVFPCMPGGKRPLTAHGFHNATTDPDQVRAWWGRNSEANIGVPTGAPSAIVVVDVDVHGSVDGFSAFSRAHQAGLVEGWQLLVSTPSGGMHAYYPTAGSQNQRSWQAASAGIDFRGEGGYIVVPPSQVLTNGGGGGYRVRRVNAGASAMLDSDRLRDFLDPRPAPRHPVGPGFRRNADVSRLAAWVAARAQGERNRGLFWAACRLAENGIPTSDALDVLRAAASDAGLGEREIIATVRSAYRAAHPGKRDPTASSARAAAPSEPGTWFARDPASAGPANARGL
ncbi:bifunctional DNA primase/polymerase [Pseudoclavibacter helvolus]|uniref:bifunctional DNA primase/polymerase n=1 Tax=Pseudoclavibacter helvolus TaxID=255205 RepID=UPI0024ADD533|nr:bifunctional DNA primase/polymerase [Pseudoclavibacter helvolus]